MAAAEGGMAAWAALTAGPQRDDDMKKGFRALLDEANAEVEAISVQQANALLGDDNTVFVDLRDRKVRNIEATGADVIATGNIGCITQIASGSGLPIIHTVKLLDWAYGGPRPEGVPETSPVLEAAE